MNNEILQQLKLTQGFLHAQGRKGFRFHDDPDQYESLVTVYKEKTQSEHLTDNERFNILGSLLGGEAEVVYNRYLCSPNKTLALERVWRSLELAYGYREKNPMTEIYELSTRPSVESSSQGLRSLRKDLIFCLGRVETNNSATLDNPALVNNFVRRLPNNFRKQYIQRALDSDITRNFNDLMTYITRCLRAVERDPDDWVEHVDAPKKIVNNPARGRSNKTDVQRTSNNLVENNTATVSTVKLNNTTYTPAATGRSDYSHYVCAFCRATGHVMWRCDKYLNLNIDQRLEYVKHHDHCTNCLGKHHIDHCTSQSTCFKCR